MKYQTILTFIFLYCSTSYSQVENIDTLNEESKKKEIIETLEWIKSKTGAENYITNFYDDIIYSEIIINYQDPYILQILNYVITSDNDLKSLREYTLDLRDISNFVIGFTLGPKIWVPELRTYRDDLKIQFKKEDKNYVTNKVSFHFDYSVESERIKKALNYLLELTKMERDYINEKF